MNKKSTNIEHRVVPEKIKKVRKENGLEWDWFTKDFFFYLVEGNRESFIREIPILLQIEGNPKTHRSFWKETFNTEMD